MIEMRDYANPLDLPNEYSCTYDVIVVGAGAAGLYTALNLDNRLQVAVLDKLGLHESNSNYAQGGIAAVTLSSDSWESHLNDTLIAGSGLCDQKAVEILVREGPENIRALIDIGVPFDRDERGQVRLCLEGAHSRPRILHCGGDATGYHLMRTLIDVAGQRTNISMLHEVTLFDVLTDDHDSVCGILAQTSAGQFIAMRAPCVVLASGGVGRVYRNSTNSACATGDGIAAAIRAGARVKDMEFVQFHPTALIHPDQHQRFFLISEALRGEGAILRNRLWEPFMKGIHPQADLAPRDIVARAIVREMQRHDLPNVYLDITAKPRAFLRDRFPVIYETCMERGIDIAVNWIPVMPVQHYFMGGVEADVDGRTSVSGLYACGETACTGIHGANRLASNSLLECLVFGRRCARSINHLESHTTTAAKPPIVSPPRRTVREGPFDYDTARSLIRHTMTQKGGIIRNSADLALASRLVKDTLEEMDDLRLTDRTAIETINITTVADHILAAAIKRKTSVGSHYREDHAPDEPVKTSVWAGDIDFVDISLDMNDYE